MQRMENWLTKYSQSRHINFPSVINRLGFRLRWTGVKDITKLVTIPGSSRQACVGVIDSEKGTIVDVINKYVTSDTFHKSEIFSHFEFRKVVRTVPNWDGSCTTDGKYGLYAPSSGDLVK